MMQYVLKILLVPAFWVIFFLVLQINYPQIYCEVERAFKVEKITFTNSDLQESFLRTKLPESRSIIYWVLFKKKIANNFLRDPVFKDVDIKRCAWWQLDCYELLITARQPAYLHINSGQFWIVDDQGVFIRAVSSSDFFDLPKVYLSADETLAPQVMQARHKTAYEVLSLMKGSKFKITQINFLDSGELSLQFKGNDFTLILSPELEDKVSLLEQINRFEKIVDDLGSAIKAVEKIDLGFDIQAVVTPKTAEEIEENSQ